MNRLIKITTLALLAAMVCSCAGNKPVSVDPTVVLAYQKNHSAENLDTLSKVYGAVLYADSSLQVIQPGLYADYAVTLAQLGRPAEANVWFNKEMASFPASKQYVMKLKGQLIPEYLNDNNTDITKVVSNDNADQKDQVKKDKKDKKSAVKGKKDKKPAAKGKKGKKPAAKGKKGSKSSKSVAKTSKNKKDTAISDDPGDSNASVSDKDKKTKTKKSSKKPSKKPTKKPTKKSKNNKH